MSTVDASRKSAGSRGAPALAGLLAVLAVLQFGYTVTTEDRSTIIAGTLLGLGVLGVASLALRGWWRAGITLAMATALVAAGAAVWLRPGLLDPAALPDLRFTPPAGTVAMCHDLTGTGDIPAGHHLAIFDRSLSEPNASYYFDGLASDTDTGWRLLNVTLGGPREAGVRVELVAVLVPGEVGEYLRQVDADDTWWSATVPGPPVDRMAVQRGERPGPPCPGA